MSDSELKKSTLRIPPDLHERLKIKLARGGSIQQVALALLEEWASGKPEPKPAQEAAAAISRDHQKWVDTLLLILRSGDKGCIHAVTSNLVQFERALRLSRPEADKKLS